MPSRGNRACVGSEAGTGLVCFSNRKEGRASRGDGTGEAGRLRGRTASQASRGSLGSLGQSCGTIPALGTRSSPLRPLHIRLGHPPSSHPTPPSSRKPSLASSPPGPAWPPLGIGHVFINPRLRVQLAIPCLLVTGRCAPRGRTTCEHPLQPFATVWHSGSWLYPFTNERARG